MLASATRRTDSFGAASLFVLCMGWLSSLRRAPTAATITFDAVQGQSHAVNCGLPQCRHVAAARISQHYDSERSAEGALSRRGYTLGLALLAICAAACSPPPAEEPAASVAPPAAGVPSAEPGWTGLTVPDEIIEARRVLMIEAERLMKPVDSFIAGEPADAAVLRANATTIEALLLALPHLFPPTTNRFVRDELDPPTLALPALWQRFPAFLTFAGSAERAAAALRDANDTEALRAASVRLRSTCDVCHTAFMKPYTPPVVTDEDLSFDFESVFQ